MPPLRIIFMGTPRFAVASLEVLLKNNCNIVAVITAPDKPAGRGLELQVSEVKAFALSKNIPLLQPANLKDEKFHALLKTFVADLQIVVAFRMLPEVVWNMPRLGTVNLHGSLLPQYRGAAPINRAIMNGEKKTGVTTFFLQKEIDTGKIIFRESTEIGEEETAGELHDRLMLMGANLVLKTIQSIEAGDFTQTDQTSLLKENEPLYMANKLFKEDCRIRWDQNLDMIHNFIRGLSPYPAAHTELVSSEGNKLILKIFRATKERNIGNDVPGTIVSDAKNYIKIVVDGGLLNIEEIQLSGKRKMSVSDFLRGFPLKGKWKVI